MSAVKKRRALLGLMIEVRAWLAGTGEIRETKNLHPQAVKRVFTAPTPRIQILSRSAAKEGDPWRKK